jgi:hypothetical protein
MTKDDDDFKVAIFNSGNADFDLAAWAWARNFDLAGDTVE